MGRSPYSTDYTGNSAPKTVERPQNKHLKPMVNGEVARNIQGLNGGSIKVITAARKINAETFAMGIKNLMCLKEEDLEEIVANPDTIMAEKLCAAVMLDALKKRDQTKLEFLLARSCGAVKQVIDVGTSPDSKIDLSKLTLAELEALKVMVSKGGAPRDVTATATVSAASDTHGGFTKAHVPTATATDISNMDFNKGTTII